MKQSLETTTALNVAFSKVAAPKPNSHKGENGKLLFIGGSQLFHAPVRWSLMTASRFVDMLFYAAVPQTERLLEEARGQFWDGIVIPRIHLEAYLVEADCILIGPGMERQNYRAAADLQLRTEPTEQEWNEDTGKVVNYLLSKYPNKKWVVDAGALQMVDPTVLTSSCIVTPHSRELEQLAAHEGSSVADLQQDLQKRGVTQFLKGQVDSVTTATGTISIEGGSPGMTKGGTGDVLAGLVAGLFTTNTAEVAALVASQVSKQAGEDLATTMGTFFNASDIAEQIPKTFFRILEERAGRWS